MSRMLSIVVAIASLALAAPTDAFAQAAPQNFKAQYLFYTGPPPPSPSSVIVLPYQRAKFTLAADGTWSNDEGNGGEWETQGTTLLLYFIDKASATALYPPFGAAIWQGTMANNMICNGRIRGSNGETGLWSTKGCP